MDKVTRLAEIILPMLKDYGATTVVGPAMGGLVIGQEVARQLVRFVFLEKVDNQLALRRNFNDGRKGAYSQDVITRWPRSRGTHPMPSARRRTSRCRRDRRPQPWQD